MRPVAALSLGNFFAAGHFFLIIYILAPYLATVMPVEVAGLAISLGAVFTLACFPLLPRIVGKFGPRRLAILFAVLEMVLLLGLSLMPSALIAVLFAAILCAIAPFLGYQLDLLLEGVVTDEGATGRIRTLFLTTGNLALVIAPIVTGLLLDGTSEYGRVFLVSAIALAPFILIMATTKLPETEPPKRTNIKDACICVMADKDLRSIALANASLQLFFHLAPLYIPLYLHTALGMQWDQLGWMFAVMLLPFVFLEYPVGWLADRMLGDKRIMATGFVITGLSFAAIGVITTGTPLAAILTILVLTRIGAALVEASVEGHFFRRVTADDANTVSLFRMMRPIGALIAPIIGSILLATGGYGALFSVTGIIVFLGGLLSALSILEARREDNLLCQIFGSCHRARA